MPNVASDRASIHYQLVGPEDGSVIVFAHTVDDRQCRYDYLTRRKGTENSDTDLPVKPQGTDHRFDPVAQPAGGRVCQR